MHGMIKYHIFTPFSLFLCQRCKNCSGWQCLISSLKMSMFVIFLGVHFTWLEVERVFCCFNEMSMNILYLQRGPSSHCNKSWWISPLYKVSVWGARSTCIYILSFCWVVNLADNYYKSFRQSSQPHMYLYWWWEI